MIVAKAPTRLDFGGGWTDVPPFPEERGGFVCNMAIDHYATVSLVTYSDSQVRAHGLRERTPSLIGAALRRAGANNVHVELQNDFPVGAGLGGSSAAGVALAAALAMYDGRECAPGALAEWSRAVEVEEMGIAGGRQDHYAAAFGGALGLTFSERVDVDVIHISNALARTLERRCLLAYTGESRISATTITAVLEAYRDRVPRVLLALEAMRTLAQDMRDALRDDDVDRLAALVHEHWHYQRALHPAITTERINTIEAASYGAGAIGMKALGASGGGCVIVFTPDDDDGRVAQAIASFATVLPWHIARDGVTVRLV